jgi:hypothetical protein
MAERYREWNGPARTMVFAIDDAVHAARAGDGDAFAQAIAALTGLDREQLVQVLGAVSRELLERAFPDGLDAADAGEVLESCIRATVGWYPGLDTDALLRALTGALGLTDPDDGPVMDPGSVLVHGVLLIADQLNSRGEQLAPILTSALAELQRAQTVELP